MKHSLIAIPAVALIAAGVVNAQEIVQVPASQAQVSLPEDMFSLPPGQWFVSRLISQGNQPCAPDACEAGFHSGDLAISVEHAKDYVRVIAGFRGCKGVAFQEVQTGAKPGSYGRSEVSHLLKKVVKAAEKSCNAKAPTVPKLDVASLFPKAGT
jgi:hypothetical protein